MKTKATILATLILALLTLTTYSGVTAQLNKRQPFLRGLTPPIPTSPAAFSEIGSGGEPEAISLRSLGSKQGNRSNRAHVDSTAFLKSVKVDPDAPNLPTIPHWSDTFTYHGLEYKYTMVGTDPKRGSATTVVPTVLIPLRFVFADGNVFDASTDLVDGQTSIAGIINSPIFQNYDFVSGGTHVGNTQYGDAFQRANFWDSVSTRSPNYHVLLGQPTVLPTQTINVPAGLESYSTDPVTGLTVPNVDLAFLRSQTDPILTASNVSPTTLPIMVWGVVSGGSVGGYHEVTILNGNIQTYIATSYSYQNLFGHLGDVYALSHEVAEWMDDPFINNFTPGWNIPFLIPVDRCDSTGLDLLEVGDPVAIFIEALVGLPGGSFTYHVTEAMFIDFFTRSSRSRSVNGQYSFFEIGAPYGLLTGPSSPCTGHVEFNPTYIEFPGASSTAVTGINNRGDATGFYSDASGQHGFVLTGSSYTTLDFPGSLVTDPNKINQLGKVVGTFEDSSDLIHGFSYSNGVWTQIDFPGSSDTEACGVNSAGDVVGVYDQFQPITHAFLLRNGKFQTIDTPFGTQAITRGINDIGLITGVGFTDGFNGPFTAFTLSRKGFTQFAFPSAFLSDPYSVNNSNDLAGFFYDPDGTAWGMVTVYSYPYQVFAGVFGNNDQGQICGYTFDASAHRYKGFIGELPLQSNSH